MSSTRVRLGVRGQAASGRRFDGFENLGSKTYMMTVMSFRGHYTNETEDFRYQHEEGWCC